MVRNYIGVFFPKFYRFHIGTKQTPIYTHRLFPTKAHIAIHTYIQHSSSIHLIVSLQKDHLISNAWHGHKWGKEGDRLYRHLSCSSSSLFVRCYLPISWHHPQNLQSLSPSPLCSSTYLRCDTSQQWNRKEVCLGYKGYVFGLGLLIYKNIFNIILML